MTLKNILCLFNTAFCKKEMSWVDWNPPVLRKCSCCSLSLCICISTVIVKKASTPRQVPNCVSYVTLVS